MSRKATSSTAPFGSQDLTPADRDQLAYLARPAVQSDGSSSMATTVDIIVRTLCPALDQDDPMLLAQSALRYAIEGVHDNNAFGVGDVPRSHVIEDPGAANSSGDLDDPFAAAAAAAADATAAAAGGIKYELAKSRVDVHYRDMSRPPTTIWTDITTLLMASPVLSHLASVFNTGIATSGSNGVAHPFWRDLSSVAFRVSIARGHRVPLNKGVCSRGLLIVARGHLQSTIGTTTTSLKHTSVVTSPSTVAEHCLFGALDTASMWRESSSAAEWGHAWSQCGKQSVYAETPCVLFCIPAGAFSAVVARHRSRDNESQLVQQLSRAEFHALLRHTPNTSPESLAKPLMGDAPDSVNVAALMKAIEAAEQRWNGELNTFTLNPLATPKIPACFRLSFMETNTGLTNGASAGEGASGGVISGFSSDNDDKPMMSLSTGKKKARKVKKQKPEDQEAAVAADVELKTHALRLGSDAVDWLHSRLDALTREGPDMTRQVSKVDALLEIVKTEAEKGNATIQLSVAVDESKIYRCKNARCGNTDPMKFATDKRAGQIACMKCGTLAVSRLAHEGQEFRNFSDKPSRNTQGPTHNSMYSLSYNTATRVSVPSARDSAISEEAGAALSRSNQAMHSNVERTDGSDNRFTRQVYKDQQKKIAQNRFQEVASSLQISEAICNRALRLFSAYRDRVEQLREFPGTLAACMINAIREGDAETTAAQAADLEREQLYHEEASIDCNPKVKHINIEGWWDTLVVPEDDKVVGVVGRRKLLQAQMALRLALLSMQNVSGKELGSDTSYAAEDCVFAGGLEAAVQRGMHDFHKVKSSWSGTPTQLLWNSTENAHKWLGRVLGVQASGSAATEGQWDGETLPRMWWWDPYVLGFAPKCMMREDGDDATSSSSSRGNSWTEDEDEAGMEVERAGVAELCSALRNLGGKSTRAPVAKIAAEFSKCSARAQKLAKRLLEDSDVHGSFVPMDMQETGTHDVLDTEHICRFLEDGAVMLGRLRALNWEQLANNIKKVSAHTNAGSAVNPGQVDRMKAIALEATSIYKELKDKFAAGWAAAQAQLERAPVKAKEARAKMMAELDGKPMKTRVALVSRNWKKWRGLVSGDSGCLKACRTAFESLLRAWVNLDRDLVRRVFNECGLLPHVTLSITAGGGGSSLKCWTMRQPPLPPPLNLFALVQSAVSKFESLGPAEGSMEAMRILVPQRLAVLSDYTGCRCLVKMSKYKVYAERTAIRTQIATGALRNGDKSDNREHMHRRKPPPSGFRRHKFAREDFRGGESAAKRARLG